MTSAPITEMKSYLVGNVASVSKGQEVANTESFSKVFDKTQSPAENKNGNQGAKKVEELDRHETQVKMQKGKTSENLKGQSNEVNDEVNLEDMEKAAEEVAGMMVEKVAEAFGITAEEVNAVLEDLGLTSLDLLNSENLTQVVLALNPDTDAFTLMTNEGLYADLKNLMNVANDFKNQLAEQFSLSEEELADLMNVMKEQVQMQKVAENPMENQESGIDNLNPAVAELTPETIPVEVEVDYPEETFKETTNLKNTRMETIVETETYEGTVVPKTESSHGSNKSTSDSNQNSNQNLAQNFNQQLVNQLADAVDNVTGSSTSYGVSGQEILRQITDYIKLHVNTETTEMELQLHPASLGNIKVQLASTEGVLTAVFTTENETVKAALEAQLIQLKDNFAQQGLKVESVEVNVSAQGFERSLDQQEQQNQNQFQNQTNKRTNRRIRIDGGSDGDDFIAEGISEEDRVVADMMMRNGNTVDYTV